MIIEKPRELAALRTLWKQAFGDEDPFLDSFFKVGFSRERCRCAVVDGVVAAAAYWFEVAQNKRKLAYIYAVATDERFRRRGICHELMAHIHGVLREDGYDGAILVPGSESLFRLYESMGYRPFGAMERRSCEAGEKAARLEKLSKEEYARLRRQMLPEGGVVQEGALLDFLATQVDFYAGSDFLLCAALSSQQVIIPEFLGNGEQLPGVIRALGGKRGVAGLPGGDQPFAMYLPFSKKGAESPAYFGLALD